MTNPFDGYKSKCRIVYMDSTRGHGQTYFAVEYTTLAEVQKAYDDQSDEFFENFDTVPKHYIMPKAIEVFTVKRNWLNLDKDEKFSYGHDIEVRETTEVGEIK